MQDSLGGGQSPGEPAPQFSVVLIVNSSGFACGMGEDDLDALSQIMLAYGPPLLPGIDGAAIWQPDGFHCDCRRHFAELDRLELPPLLPPLEDYLAL